MKEFSASLDKRSKLFTILGFILIVFVVGQLFLSPDIQSKMNSVVLDLVLVSPLLVLVVPYLFRPLKYIVTSDEIIIKRPIKSYVIKISDVKKIQPVSKEEMGGIIRVFGSGGFFGYFGKFRSKNFGMMKFFATRYSDFVYILTAMGENIVLTPDDVESFVKEIENNANKIG